MNGEIETLTEDDRGDLQRGYRHDAGNKALRIIDAQAKRIAALEEQLPEDMKHYTIVFKECPVGHGRLTATNWIDRGCTACLLREIQAITEKAFT